MRRLTPLLAAIVLVVIAPGVALAQGGGASQTGTINGKVTDTSGAVLPGASVTVASPSMMGTQNTVTNESGSYRFPAVPPGVYAITYELQGFNTLKREGIQIALGFTATVNVELTVAALQETVTVTGESPVIDTSATRVQQNFKLEQLQSIPNARDMWSLLAIAPAVNMSRIDVGGNRAGTQTGYTAYGYSGQNRVLVEGINTTEGTSGAGFYFDYGSFEEVFLGMAAQGAEMPNPGVQSQFLGKSGGNNFQGEIYLDYENNALEGSNISDAQVARGVRQGSNEIEGYRDSSFNVGGPIKKDKIWWYASYRDQKNQVLIPAFRFDKTFDTRLWNLAGKGTYQMSQNHKLVGYYQWGQKAQPNRTFDSTYFYDSPEYTRKQDSGSWVYKGEWNGTLRNNLYVEARYGDFGYYFPLIGYTDEPWREDSGTRVASGGDQRQELDRDRRQWTGAATYFKDGFLGGSHSVKFGGELLLEKRHEGFEQIRALNMRHQFNNGTAQTVIFGFPTADCKVGRLHISDCLLSKAALDHLNFFFNDQWSIGSHLTLNIGTRYDRYRSWNPEQRQVASTTGPFSIEAQTFPERTLFVWNSVVPRAGLVYDIGGDGKTVLKVNYGFFTHNPGPNVASSANPNQASKTVTYEWTDRNGNRRWDPGEEGLRTRSALAGNVRIDPNIRQPYSHEMAVFVERELVRDVGARVGFVYKSEDDLWQTYRPFRGLEAHTVPFTFVDIGVDGLSRTADDRTLTFLGLPRARISEFPDTQVIMNTGEFARYKTIEASANKRYSARWSASAGFGYTWYHDFPADEYPQSPNGPFDEKYTRWNFKATGTYDAAWGVRVSPVLRYQQGLPFARTISVTAPSSSLALFDRTTLYVEPYRTNRRDNITVFDVRVEKTMNLKGSTRVRLFVDLFNIFNNNAAETISVATGSSYLAPTAILGPRVARLGFRFLW